MSSYVEYGYCLPSGSIADPSRKVFYPASEAHARLVVAGHHRAFLVRRSVGAWERVDEAVAEVTDTTVAQRLDEARRRKNQKIVSWREAAERLQASVDRVRALHTEHDTDGVAYCDECNWFMPCPTIQALDGDA